jgi:mono/diheme cytochrome c family protein
VQGFEVVLNSVFPEQIMSGQVHAFSVNPESLETTGMVHAKHPNRTIRLPKLNSTALFGAGWIDRMSEMSIRNNHRRATAKSVASEFGGDFTNVMPGRLRVLADGRIGRFGWKAQFATLREFVAAASANELGLSSSIAPLATPLGDVPVSAGANIAPDLDERKLSSLVGFVDTLPRPVELTPPNSADMALVEQGRKMFVSIGCAGCHTPDLGGVKGVYSDLALHEIEDPPPSSSYFSPLNVPRGPRDDPQADEWRTPPLWGVADSAPYLHDGSAATLHDAILRHRGSTRHVTERYVKFAERPILAFLNTLKAPPNATPVKSTNVDSVRVVSR